MTQLGSTRFEGDTWDLASSVGSTATMVAAARAAASRDPRAAATDQFAEPLVRAVGVDFFARMAPIRRSAVRLGRTELGAR